MKSRLVCIASIAFVLSGCRGSVMPSAVPPQPNNAHRGTSTSIDVYLAGGFPKNGPAANVNSISFIPWGGTNTPSVWNPSRSECTPTQQCAFKFRVADVTKPIVVRCYDRPDAKGHLLSTTFVVSNVYGDDIGVTLRGEVYPTVVSFGNPNPPFGVKAKIPVIGVGYGGTGQFIIGPAPWNHTVELHATGGRLSKTIVSSAVDPVFITYAGGYENPTVAVVGKRPPVGAFPPILRPMLNATERSGKLNTSNYLAVARDGSVWMTANCVLARIESDLRTESHRFPAGAECPSVLTTGPDGNVWFAGGQLFPMGPTDVGFITPKGKITVYPMPDAHELGPITMGPDKNLWAVDILYSGIYKITPDGKYTQIPYVLDSPYPRGIASSPDGNLWITDSHGIVVLSTAGTLVTRHKHGADHFIVRDNRLYSFEADTDGGSIAEFNTNGNVLARYRPLGGLGFLYNSQLALGRDGAIWYAFGMTVEPGSVIKVGRIDKNGRYSELGLPIHQSDHSDLAGLISGGDGHLYYERGPFLGRITVP